MHSEGYRSGHNEAVLKTVCLCGHVGSNPTPSAKKAHLRVCFLLLTNHPLNLKRNLFVLLLHDILLTNVVITCIIS